MRAEGWSGCWSKEISRGVITTRSGMGKTNPGVPSLRESTGIDWRRTACPKPERWFWCADPIGGEKLCGPCCAHYSAPARIVKDFTTCPGASCYLLHKPPDVSRRRGDSGSALERRCCTRPGRVDSQNLRQRKLPPTF